MEHRASQVERDGVVYRVEGRPLTPRTFYGGLREKRLARPSTDVRCLVPGVRGWALGLLFFVAAAAAGRVAWGLLQSGTRAGCQRPSPSSVECSPSFLEWPD